MAELMEYKCPACGGAMEFDTKSQKMKCPYCDTEMDPAEFQTEEEAAETGTQGKWTAGDLETWSETDTNGMSVYACESCGGEIVADQTTGAATCPFCGNRIVMKGQFAGDLKPNYVVPFKKDKKSAKGYYYEYLKNKKFLPKIFKDENHIDEIKGIYVPFWLFDGKAQADCEFNAQQIKMWTTGNTEYTKIDTYRVFRAGNVRFRQVPADASKKMDDALMDSIEPFVFKDAVPFNPAYLAGYMAERYDVKAEECFDRAKIRMENTTENTMKKSVQGYDNVSVLHKTINIQDAEYSYALYPVWILNTTWHNKKYIFAMNGQTGKMTGDLPVDKKAVWLYRLTRGGLYGAILFALFYILMML